MKKYVKANTENMKPIIPDEFRTWYKVATIDDLVGLGIDEVLPYTYPHYDLECIGYAVAKPKYFEPLGDSGLEIVDIARDLNSGEIMLVQQVGGRVYNLDLNEVKRSAIG